MKLDVEFRGDYLLTVWIGRRWIVSIGTPREEWGYWAWGQRGYDGVYDEWAFGPLGRVDRVADWVVDSKDEG